MSTRIAFLLVVFVLLMMACGLVAPQPSTPTSQPTPSATHIEVAATTGSLAVEIVYTGQWYRETFGYQPDAPNIRHVVLVMPVDDPRHLEGAGWVFTNLEFTPSPEPLSMRDDAVEYFPFLEFLYDAPGGLALIELPPGKYNAAAAFIAAATPPPDDDSLLWAGVTGGGASNEFQVVEIAAGESTQYYAELTDDNGWGSVETLAFK